jgi:hypothetical protein
VTVQESGRTSGGGSLDPLYEQITMGVILLAAVGLDARTARTA